jgi:hypothetical protein
MPRTISMLATAILLLWAHDVKGQAAITALQTAYTQDFNSLIGSGSTPFVNDSTIPGWYHERSGTGDLLIAGTGSSNVGGLYSFGTANAQDRALGSIGSGNSTVGDLCWGLRLSNNTGETITALAVGYTGEQWRFSGNTDPQTVTFSWQTGAAPGSLGSGVWTAVPALDFTSPVTSGSSGALDGNLPAHRVTRFAILPVTLAPGEEIMLRWFDADHPGADHGLAIDDVSVTAYGATLPTMVAFTSPASAFHEHAGTVSVGVDISNPDPVHATMVDVLPAGGTAVNGVDVLPAYSTQTLTFPAGNASRQYIQITIADDSVFTGNRNMVFALQHVSGGNNAAIAAPDMHTLTILEDDPPPVPDVLVQEYFNAYGNIGTDEAVELLVVRDGLDLRGCSLADATSGGSYPYGVLTFSQDALWSDLQAGTMIVIGGMFAVPLPDLDASDGLLRVQAPTPGNSNAYLAHSRPPLSIAGSSDAVAMRDANDNFIHGLAHGSANQATLPPGLHGYYDGTLPAAAALGFTASDSAMTYRDFLSDFHTDTSPPSLGFPNDTLGNRAWLRKLRSRVVTENRTLAGRFFRDVSILNGATVTQTGPVAISGRLHVVEGTYDENGCGLTIDGAGDPANGSGDGDLLLGIGSGNGALLLLPKETPSVSGRTVFDAGDATVHYKGNTAQTVLSAAYNNLTLSNGGTAEPASPTAAIRVDGILNIGASTTLRTDSLTITLGEYGRFVNNGAFIGSIRSTRRTDNGMEDFGGIGVTLTGGGSPPSAREFITVTMHSGSYRWVDHRPSILRSYHVNAGSVTVPAYQMRIGYDPQDLNGQQEAQLALYRLDNDGMTWQKPAATLDMTARTLSPDSGMVTGLWTMHATPPQGLIVAHPMALTFEAEQGGALPAATSLQIGNAHGNGSIVEWTAMPSTVELPPWLALTPQPARGVNTGTIAVAVTRSDLAPGWYYGDITISDPHATNNPVVIPVSYRIYQARTLSIGTDTLRLKVTFKRPAVAFSVPVINGGESFGPGRILWSAATATPWLRLQDTQGMEGEAFSMYIDASGKPSGTYRGEIVLDGSNSVTGAPIGNAPLRIPVILEVEAWGPVSRNVASIAAGNRVSFTNAYGHLIATLEVTEGTVEQFSIQLFPYTLPRNIHRLRYACRHYIIAASGTYRAQLTLFHTLSERVPAAITDPAALRLWRQSPAQFQWTPTAGYATPLEQSVTGSDLSDLNGIWAMASPLSPARYFTNLRITRLTQEKTELSWTDQGTAAGSGYIIERNIEGTPGWRSIGILPHSEHGEYRFTDKDANTGGLRYRLLSFDAEGNARQSQEVALPASTILSDEAAMRQRLALEQNAPNPASIAAGHSTIRFSLPTAGNAQVTLYDGRGRLVSVLTDGFQTAGIHTITLPLAGLAPGMYLYRLHCATGVRTRTMMVIR